MKHTHTPGPWYLEEQRTPERLEVWGETKACGDDVLVSIDNSSPEDLANAHLIAAAPDGLAFAERMMLYFGKNPNGYEDLREMCRSYIAKARGES